MGSGSNGPYGSNNSGFSGSQPYAPTYHVVDTALENDKTDPDIYNPQKGYFHNPTATSLDDAIDVNRVVVDGKRQDGAITYVLDENDTIIIGKRVNPNHPEKHKRAPHPTLIGGKDPQVQCAGMITFHKGRIFSVDNNSGHFRPNKKSMEKVFNALKKLYDTNPEVFDKGFKWR